MRKFLVLLFCMFNIALVGCGGGGSSGGLPSSGTPAPVFTITGTWSAMSAGGIYNLTLDEAAGTLTYARPDEATGVVATVSMSGMKRGSDGAYVFVSGFVVGGLPLDVRLYRVDDHTLAGAILAQQGGALKLSPVVASKGAVADISQFKGQWNFNWSDCDYLADTGRCAFVAGSAFAQFDGLVLTQCFNPATPATGCGTKTTVLTLNALGGGIYGTNDPAGTERMQAFTVGGQPMVFDHWRSTTLPRPMTALTYYAPITTAAATAFNGTWRVTRSDGRSGVATISGDTFKVVVAGLPDVTGTFKRNTPWAGQSRIDITGEANPYFVVGNDKLLVASGGLGQYVLHRE